MITPTRPDAATTMTSVHSAGAPEAPPASAPPMPWAQAYVDRYAEIYWYTPKSPRLTAFADRVIGSPMGYSSLDEAKRAVTELHPFTPGEIDIDKLAKGVVYIDNGFGAFAALELDSPLAKRHGIFAKKLYDGTMFAQYPMAPNSGKIVGVQNARGAFLPDYGPDHRM